MLLPTRVKYRKQHRGRLCGPSKRGLHVSFGEYGLQALGNSWITARQIESVRVTLARFTKRGGKLWIRIFPDKPISKKPAETRMGKGKGSPEFWVAVVKRGRVMFELGGMSKREAQEGLRLAAHKLPIPTQFISREEDLVHG